MGPSAIVLDRFAADSEHDRGGDKRMLPRTGGFKMIRSEGHPDVSSSISVGLSVAVSKLESI